MEQKELNHKKIMLRVKWIREDQNLSLRAFSDTLGVSKSVTDNIIYQRVDKVKDLYINLICDKLNINRTWLLFGEGEPYCADRSKNPEFSKWVSEIAEDSNSYLRELMTKISLLNDEDLQLTNQIINRFLAKSSPK